MMPGMKTPSVGRIVHYVAYGTPGGEYREGAHRAAIITEVTPGLSEVSLAILNPTGMFFNQCVPHSSTFAPGSWHWPEIV